MGPHTTVIGLPRSTIGRETATPCPVILFFPFRLSLAGPTMPRLLRLAQASLRPGIPRCPRLVHAADPPVVSPVRLKRYKIVTSTQGKGEPVMFIPRVRLPPPASWRFPARADIWPKITSHCSRRSRSRFSGQANQGRSVRT